VSPPPQDNELLAVHISRRDLQELIAVLRKAEDLCNGMRVSANEFRMHRVRLEVLRQSSVPPPPPPTPVPRDSKHYIAIEELGDLRAKEKPKGSSR
jgi:hypothetical protein